MERSVQVTIAATVVMLGSFVASLLAAAMLLVKDQPAPPGAPYSAQAIVVVGMLFWGSLAVLGFSTGVGIFQRWKWARFSMISFGIVLAVVALISIPVLIAIMRNAPMPNTSPDVTRVLTFAIVSFYLLLAVVGTWFAILFSRPRVEEFFRGEEPESPHEGIKRPVQITIVSVLMLLGLFSIPVLFSSNMPFFFFGHVLHGPLGRLVFLVWIAVYGITGIGLLRLKRWAWPTALTVFLLGLLNQAVVFLPGRQEMFAAALREMSAGQEVPQTAILAARVGLWIGLVFILIPIYLLMVSRTKYYAACERREQGSLTPPEQPSR